VKIFSFEFILGFEAAYLYFWRLWIDLTRFLGVFLGILG
jgi:hypothetical protein